MRLSLTCLALASLATGCAALPGGLPGAGGQPAESRPPQAEAQARAPEDGTKVNVDLGFLSGVTLVTSTSSVAEPLGSAASP